MFTNHFLFLVKVRQIRLAYSLFHSVFQAIALSNAVQREEAMILVMELAAACPNADLLGCRVVSVCVMQPCSIISVDLCTRTLDIPTRSARN